jgi:rhodanese-related sulfurtransferase
MITEINAQELKEKLTSGDSFKFIDCRELGEWEEGHIEGATLIPLSEFQEKYEAALTDKNETIVIQCRSGKRSMNACMFLLSKGYNNLINLEDGIMGWMAEGYPVTQD